MYIGVDIGGTTGRVAGFHSLDTPKPDRRKDFPMTTEYDQDFPNLVAAIKEVSGDEPFGIGAGIAGALNQDRTGIYASGGLAGWHDYPVVADLTEAFKCPVILRHDAHTAAMSEAIYGKSAGHDFWFLIWGTGIGGALVQAEENGPVINTSELGHQSLDWTDDGPTDGCKRPGCWESFASGRGILARYGKPPEKISEDAWEQVTAHMAQGIYNLVMIHPAARIVLGGGISVKQRHRLAVIQEELNRQMKFLRIPKLQLVTHGHQAGLVGALALLRASGGLTAEQDDL